MERILSVTQMRSADEFTINNLGVDQNELVFRAGKCVADEIIKRFRGGRVLVCIGKGNNGADGRVISELLSKTHGFSVTTLLASSNMYKVLDRRFDIVVDCLFGTGLNREIDGKYRNLIEKINSLNAYVVSCDIPSGLNGDTGKVMGVAVKANLTVAIQEYKLGHFLNDGPDYSGEIVAKDIGISIWEENCVKKFSNFDANKFFCKRLRNVNKGSFGKACIIGGSKKYTGSALLSYNALTSLRVGAGYSYLCVPKSLFNVYALKVPETILLTIDDDDGEMLFDKNALDFVLNFDSISIGMGCGVSRSIFEIIVYLLKNYKGKLIIDADGLNSLSKYGVSVLKDKSCDVVLTPHVGEFSRLSSVHKDLILTQPVEYAKQFAKEYGVTLLLKNAISIITNGDDCFINATGTPAMAKAGSGDVLSGVLCGVLARSDDVFHATVASAYVFGRTGEIVTSKFNEYSVVASDLVANISNAINSLF